MKRKKRKKGEDKGGKGIWKGNIDVCYACRRNEKWKNAGIKEMCFFTALDPGVEGLLFPIHSHT